VLNGTRVAQFESAPVLSVNSGGSRSGWAIQISRPLSVVGAPLFNSQNQVIGIMADQPSQVAGETPRFDITILTTSQMLNSANKIIKAGGDIPTGWLGVGTASESQSKSGVTISNVNDDSPAFKAGLLPGDVMTKWNGTAIRDEGKLIEMVQNTPIVSKADIEILREGQPLKLTAVIGVRLALASNPRAGFRCPRHDFLGRGASCKPR
jgi:S1-C subfamily serine protease